MTQIVVSQDALDSIRQKVLECGQAVVPHDSIQEYLADLHSYSITVDVVKHPHQTDYVTLVFDADDFVA